MEDQHGYEALDSSRNIRDKLTVWETGARGVQEYAEGLCGMSVKDFETMLAGKKVLDLGSGPARLALELAIKKRINPNFVPPEYVFSVNDRFADDKYKNLWYDRLGRDLIQEVGVENWDIIKESLKRDVLKFSRGVDWNNLDEINDEGVTFDFILSNYAFPFYSDRLDVLEKEVFNAPEDKLNLAMFGSRSKSVFKHISNLLSEGGEAYLRTKIMFSEWGEMEKDPEFKEQSSEFFESIGLHIGVRRDDDGSLILLLTKLG